MWAGISQSLNGFALDDQMLITGRGTHFCIHHCIVTDFGLKSSLVHVIQIDCKYLPSQQARFGWKRKPGCNWYLGLTCWNKTGILNLLCYSNTFLEK